MHNFRRRRKTHTHVLSLLTAATEVILAWIEGRGGSGGGPDATTGAEGGGTEGGGTPINDPRPSFVLLALLLLLLITFPVADDRGIAEGAAATPLLEPRELNEASLLLLLAAGGGEKKAMIMSHDDVIGKSAYQQQ